MKILSWNVNGLRTIWPLENIFNSFESDIICIQETRISGKNDPDLERLAFVKGYHSFFSICKEKKGYSGVATFCKKETATPCDAGEGLCGETGGTKIPEVENPCPDVSCECGGSMYTEETLTKIVEEGRCVITDHRRFVLINIYAPAVSVEGRIAFKMQFLHALRAKVQALQQAGRMVVIAGDFNICPARVDSAEPIPPMSCAAWELRPSRKWLRSMLDAGRTAMVDTYREMHPNASGIFTCWSEATRGRENNYGVRIDLILMDRGLYESDVKAAAVMAHVKGSDHCPVSVEVRHESYAGLVSDLPPQFCTQFMQRFTFRQKSLLDIQMGSVPSENDKTAHRFVSLAWKTGVPDKRLLKKIRGNSQKRIAGSNAISVSREISKEKRKQSTISTFFKKKRAASKITKNNETMLERVPSAVIEESEETNQLKPKATMTLNDRNVAQNNKVATEKQREAKRNESAKAWQKILSGPPPPPLCRHKKRCIVKTVRKSGENRGKTFFSCPYPSGIGKLANCNFFQWV